MAIGHESLAVDLEIVEQMVAGMRDYLSSGSVYSKKIDYNLMYLTLGGYLMRQQRLTELDSALDASQQVRLRNAAERFDLIRRTQLSAFEKKAGQELQARLGEWERALRELFDDGQPSMAFYRNDVEKRVVIQALIDALEAESASIKPEILGKLERLDGQLRARWQPGAFIWPAEFAAAYPADDYWWLYGELA